MISSFSNCCVSCLFVLGVTLAERNYWADNSYYSDLEVTVYGQ